MTKAGLLHCPVLTEKCDSMWPLTVFVVSEVLIVHDGEGGVKYLLERGIQCRSSRLCLREVGER